ncbi:MAG: ferrochelatase [Planctomycetes bacterium]|nr:ferrochelatase [Planctomycetota bacterium]
MIDGILLIGFGGPTPGCCARRQDCPRTPGCEAECFVAGILGDNPARSRRVAEVVAHYRRLGGFSPYNDLTFRQAAALKPELARRGVALPIACGFRHWTPWADDALGALKADGASSIALAILAPHQSSVSWDWYIRHAAEAAERVGGIAIAAVAAPWWNHPGFIAAIADRLREVTAALPSERIAKAELIFTAHAVPKPVESTSPYRTQFIETARLAAAEFGHPAHTIAFQSQPGDSSIPWSVPDILSTISAVHARGARDVVIAAAGFLVDHTEVLYDLDVEAQELCARLGVGYHRARCVHDHPAFIAALADRIAAAVAAPSATELPT